MREVLVILLIIGLMSDDQEQLSIIIPKKLGATIFLGNQALYGLCELWFVKQKMKQPTSCYNKPRKPDKVSQDCDELTRSYLGCKDTVLFNV